MEDRLQMMDFSAEAMKRKSAQNRRIILSEEVTRESMIKIEYWLDSLEKLDRMKGIKEPITIVVDSFGGSIYSGLALIGRIEAMKDRGYKIITEGFGVAMSMGFMLMICGSERRSNRYTRYMLHQPSSMTWGTLEDMKMEVEEVEKLWIMLKDLIKKYTKITEHDLEDLRKTKTDWYLSPQELKALGGIDIIL